MLRTSTIEYLESLVANFDTNPIAARRAMQDSLSADPGRFRRSAVGVLAKGMERKGEGLLLSTLIQNDQLATRLGDPDFCTREEAISLARRASRIDPSFERQIAQILTGATRLADEEIARLLAVIESISTPANLLPLLNSISHHSSPRIRSKAALLMGRGKRSSAWVMEQLTEPDGRVRANAVESIWGLDGADALEAFSAAACDPVPRVAINAGIGLYRARQTRSIELFTNWASHEDFAFRRSACWAMGQTQDPRFLPVLVKCIRDLDPTVRSHALKSSSIIRSHINALKQQPISVHIGHASILESGVRAISASLRCSGGSPIPILCPLAFSLAEDGVPVTRYELTRAMPDSAGAVGLVLPLSTDLATPFREAACAALRRALDEKRPSEAWSAVCYSHGDTCGPSIPPLLQTSPEQLQKGMELANRSYLSGAIPAIETVLPVLPQGPRSLVILGNENPESTSIVFHRNTNLDRLLTLLRNQSIAVHAIALPGCTPLFRSMLESLATHTGGRLIEAPTPQQLEAALVATLATAHSEYKIRYWGFEEHTAATPLHLTVITPSSFGEIHTFVQPDSR